MKNLIETIAAYKNATQGLINKTEEYEAFVKKEVPFELWDDFGLRSFGRSGQSEWHIALWRDVKILIPGSTQKFGKGFYWGGDFNYWYDYCTGKEIIEWAKELPSLIQKAEEYVTNLTKQAEELNK